MLFWTISNRETGFGGALVSGAHPGRWTVAVSHHPGAETPEDYPALRCAELVRSAIGVQLRRYVLDTPAGRERYAAGPGTAVLIRPEGYLAWPTDDGPADPLPTVGKLVNG